MEREREREKRTKEINYLLTNLADYVAFLVAPALNTLSVRILRYFTLKIKH